VRWPLRSFTITFMSKEIIHTVHVEFGDCDPANIVWFPNFFRWIDAASRYFFTQCGVPPWHETEKSLDIIGTPLVDTHSRFLHTATYGDTLNIHTSIPEWRNKSFVQHHRIMRGNEAIMECDEIRIFAGRRADNPQAIRALPIPQTIREICQ
jgi:4-hydroxybenzoyl-CoA thioesterase